MSETEKIKVYNMNDFYIGELILTSNNSEEENENLKILEQGAILLENKTICDKKEWSKKTKKIKLLTIFYYVNDNYLCLHNNKIYTQNEINIVNNLTSFIPKISFKIPQNLTITEGLTVFNFLFRQNVSLSTIYSDRKYKLKDLYLGTLVLPTEFISSNNPKEHQFLNQPLNCILSKSIKSRKTSSKSITNTTPNPLSLPLGRYIHTYYKCLFLKLPNNQGYYNINNFQIYNQENIYDSSKTDKPIGESYCEDLMPLTEILDKSQLGNNISIKKVLSKINNK